MKLRTAIESYKAKTKIELSDALLTIGSCFSQNIGDRLAENKFNCLANPFGTIYDPLSTHRLLTYAITNTAPPEESYVQTDGVWKNLHFHSSLNGSSKSELAERIKANLENTSQFLKSAKWLVITYGTAFVYRHLKYDATIANCQKLPAAEFAKELCSIAPLLEDFDALYHLIQEVNPQLNIILTVSPVRHLRDGLPENSVSKAVLRLLSHELQIKYQNVQYYPAYEIMNDDLRDYRFYKEDMIHPTGQAIDYIWEHFTSSFFTAECQNFVQKWQKIRQALAHKPFNPSTSNHQKFLNQLLADLNQLSEQRDVSKEIALVKDQIL